MRFRAWVIIIISALTSASAQHLAVMEARASSAQAEWMGPQNVISDAGLAEVAPGQVALDPGATMYNSGYGDPNDENPLIHFDFGQQRTVNRLHVWNANGAGYTWRGFKDVTLQYSDDAQHWRTQPERLRFDQAPGTQGYLGQAITLPRPITARYVRLTCNSTWRMGGNPDIASLGRVRFFAGGTPTARPPEDRAYPLDSGVVDLSKPPYSAKGDGLADDTQAIQQALLDWNGRDRLLYLPAGTYRITAPLRYPAQTSQNQNGVWGYNHLKGAGKGQTVLRLDDGIWTDPSQPKAMLDMGQMSFWNGQSEQNAADWFHCSVEGLTFHTGSNNPGAVGLQFYSNNTGVVRDVMVISGDGQGEIGLDLGHANLNGPLLVQRVRVEGFKIGVRTGFTVNSQTFEHLDLIGQSETAFDNNGQCVSVRKMRAEGPAQAFHNRYGFAVVVDAVFAGSGPASGKAAMRNGEFMFARHVSVSGFGSAIENAHGSGRNQSKSVGLDWVSHPPVLGLFGTNRRSLNLAVAEVPAPSERPAAEWANVRDFRLTTETGDSGALQRVIDSGAEIVYFPADAAIVLKSDVSIRGAVRHLVGLDATVRMVGGAKLRVSAEASHTVTISGLQGGEVVTESRQPVSLVDSRAHLSASGTGDVFLTNVTGTYRFGKQRVWARQLNSEPEGLKVANAGGRLWILGLKTERAGTLVETTDGGLTEVLGGLCYTTGSNADPMFSVVDSSASFSIAEVAYGPPPFPLLVRETVGGNTKLLERGQAPLRFQFMNGSAIPLYVAGRGPALRTPGRR